MIGLATTTIAVLRGTTTNDYGDEVDASTEVSTGIPASILEQRRLTTTTDDPQPRAVVFYTGRVLSTVDVRVGDRIKDETTDQIYIVDDFTRVSNPVIGNDTRLDLRRVNA